MVQMGSILVSQHGTVGQVHGELFNSSPVYRRIGDECWDVRTVKRYNVRIIKRGLTESGIEATQWQDSGLTLDPKTLDVRGFSLEEIRHLAAGAKLSHSIFLTKEDFLIWFNQMIALAQDQSKFGLQDLGLNTTRSAIFTFKKAHLYYFDFTNEEVDECNALIQTLWGLGYDW